MSHLHVSKFQHTQYNFGGHILLNAGNRSYSTPKKDSSNYFGMTNNIETIKLAFQI